ncbi:DUF4007 family protein [Laspinema olomoucense]|uniref:DUF4007 family protein n=1 Tax=Laspinema olomoucense D3b TaxID=2953688 RepID=A0ABT2NDG1_9CYAN|nr:DUF4007 family protein [Laspinema sp. D3b]MCT7980491.1 DUF4007 family protein [Laspinema sp. D3b]
MNPVFARHETFHPRFGWLKKGFDKAKEDPGVFLVEDAPVRLGVGKNMVRSIRYWCKVFKLLADDRPTEFGYNLLEDDGWDPFLEDPASLWLLHWNLLKPTCDAAAWHYTFNQFRRVEFSQNDLFLAVSDYGQTLKKNIAESSINKDVSCILRMYVKQRSQTKVSEDSIDQTRLYEAFGIRSPETKLREDLRVRASYIGGQSLERRLTSFAQAAADESKSDKQWLEALVMIVADKPGESWTDEDATGFEIKLSDIARRFKNLEALQKEVAAKGEGFDARRITVTRPDGEETHLMV